MPPARLPENINDIRLHDDDGIDAQYKNGVELMAYGVVGNKLQYSFDDLETIAQLISTPEHQVTRQEWRAVMTKPEFEALYNNIVKELNRIEETKSARIRIKTLDLLEQYVDTRKRDGKPIKPAEFLSLAKLMQQQGKGGNINIMNQPKFNDQRTMVINPASELGGFKEQLDTLAAYVKEKRDSMKKDK